MCQILGINSLIEYVSSDEMLEGNSFVSEVGLKLKTEGYFDVVKTG